MAKITIVGVQHECAAEGLRGQGYPVVSSVELRKGQLVTVKGELASAKNGDKPAFGYVGWDTGDKAGKVVKNQFFRVVREAWVQLDTAKTPGTKIYLSDTDGELADAPGTTNVVVGVYLPDPENGDKAAVTQSKMALLQFTAL